MSSKFVLLLLVVLVFSMVFVSLASAATTPIPTATITPTPSPSPSPSPTSTVTPSPTPTFDPNATATPTPNPTPTPTAIYVDLSNVQSINPNGAALTFSPYNQTIVSLVYAECMNSSLDVSAYNNNWYESRTSTGITFFANDVDTFTLHYRVLYGQVVNQSITLSVRSGDNTVTTLPIASVNSGFTLDVVIHTLVLPHYPTVQEQEDARKQSDQALYDKTIAFFTGESAWMKMALIAAFIIIVVILVVVYWLWRNARHTDNEINNQNARGWGRGRM